MARFCVEEYEEVNPQNWKMRKIQERKGKVYTSGTKNVQNNVLQQHTPSRGKNTRERPLKTTSKKNKADVNNKHLTNFSISKTSSKFVYTEELTEINQGTKRTLTSYWKSLAKEGYSPDKVKRSIKKCC